ncbi:MAG: hypothetical protein J4432_01475 [DPANN group archaeon]|nr:hypothetical protein [DPANN group archaeon]
MAQRKKVEKKRIDDDVRLDVLACLFEKGCLVPNLEKIQKLTGYHKSTIKASINFLAEKEVLTSFQPMINHKKYGLNVIAYTLMKTDMSQKDTIKKIEENVDRDKNLIFLSSVIGGGNWNMISTHLYPSVEEFSLGLQNRYYAKIPELSNFIQDRMIFYKTAPILHSKTYSKAAIEILKKQRAPGKLNKRGKVMAPLL